MGSHWSYFSDLAIPNINFPVRISQNLKMTAFKSAIRLSQNRFDPVYGISDLDRVIVRKGLHGHGKQNQNQQTAKRFHNPSSTVNSLDNR